MKAKDLFKEGYTDTIKAAMAEKGVTMKKLSGFGKGKSGYSYEGVRQILKGNGSYWGVYRVCHALGVAMKDIMLDTEA